MSVDMSSRGCAHLCEPWSEFHDLHLIVSVRDWSAMFVQDREE